MWERRERQRCLAVFLGGVLGVSTIQGWELSPLAREAYQPKHTWTRPLTKVRSALGASFDACMDELPARVPGDTKVEAKRQAILRSGMSMAIMYWYAFGRNDFVLNERMRKVLWYPILKGECGFTANARHAELIKIPASSFSELPWKPMPKSHTWASSLVKMDRASFEDMAVRLASRASMPGDLPFVDGEPKPRAPKYSPTPSGPAFPHFEQARDAWKPRAAPPKRPATRAAPAYHPKITPLPAASRASWVPAKAAKSYQGAAGNPMLRTHQDVDREIRQLRLWKETWRPEYQEFLNQDAALAIGYWQVMGLPLIAQQSGLRKRLAPFYDSGKHGFPEDPTRARLFRLSKEEFRKTPANFRQFPDRPPGEAVVWARKTLGLRVPTITTEWIETPLSRIKVRKQDGIEVQRWVFEKDTVPEAHSNPNAALCGDWSPGNGVVDQALFDEYQRGMKAFDRAFKEKADDDTQKLASFRVAAAAAGIWAVGGRRILGNSPEVAGAAAMGLQGRIPGLKAESGLVGRLRGIMMAGFEGPVTVDDQVPARPPQKLFEWSRSHLGCGSQPASVGQSPARIHSLFAPKRARVASAPPRRTSAPAKPNDPHAYLRRAWSPSIRTAHNSVKFRIDEIYRKTGHFSPMRIYFEGSDAQRDGYEKNNGQLTKLIRNGKSREHIARDQVGMGLPLTDAVLITETVQTGHSVAKFPRSILEAAYDFLPRGPVTAAVDKVLGRKKVVQKPRFDKDKFWRAVSQGSSYQTPTMSPAVQAMHDKWDRSRREGLARQGVIDWNDVGYGR